MSEFKEFKKLQQKHIKVLTENNEVFFTTEVNKDELWDLYLSSFPEGTNNIYKERQEFDCQCCRQYIRAMGNVVAIVNNELVSIWDIPSLPYPFDIVSKELSKLVKSSPIKNTFLAETNKIGTDSNNMLGEDDKVITWEHFYCELPNKFVNKTSKSIESVIGDHRANKDVFKRSMLELTEEAGKTILELIEQDSLYRGAEHKAAIVTFLKYKTLFNEVPTELQDNWCWVNSFKNPISKIRNTAIGTLLIDLSADMELDQAVRKFEAVVAPTNYKRPTAVITKRMIEDAEGKIKELGFEKSLARRHAKIEDLTVNDVLFVNRSNKNKMEGKSLFEELKEDIPENTKKLGKVEEVTIDDFISNILPKANSIEVLLEGKHQNNLMSLIAPVNKDAPSMLKWDNNFSWDYKGNVADSMKQRVKEAGGNVDGVLRFSIQWNDGDDNQNDFDAHCKEPNGNTIYYGSKHSRTTLGTLDIDIRRPGDKIAVENITWSSKDDLLEGEYNFIVHNFSHNGGRTGFTAEIEYEGELYSFAYDKELRQDEKVLVACVDLNKKTGIKFKKSLDASKSSKEVWNVKTNTFVKVSNIMHSPNFWESGNKTGNKHYFFFLEDCKNDSTPRGFYNEFLNNELTPHRKVFEALASKMRVEESDNQLSGVGFSSTQRAELIVRVEGSFTRTIKLKF